MLLCVEPLCLFRVFYECSYNMINPNIRNQQQKKVKHHYRIEYPLPG